MFKHSIVKQTLTLQLQLPHPLYIYNQYKIIFLCVKIIWLFFSNLDSISSFSFKNLPPSFWLEPQVWCRIDMLKIDTLVLFLSLKGKAGCISLLTELSCRSRKIQSPFMTPKWKYLKDKGCFLPRLKIFVKHSQLMIIVFKSSHGILIFLWLSMVLEFHTHFMFWSNLPVSLLTKSSPSFQTSQLHELFY